jgi:hypothetical protein
MTDNLLKITIGDLLDRQTARFGDRDALVHKVADVQVVGVPDLKYEELGLQAAASVATA